MTSLYSSLTLYITAMFLLNLGIGCNCLNMNELKVKYFTDVSLICDNTDLNITTTQSTIGSISWIFPDGSMVDASSSVDPKKYVTSGPEGITDNRFAVYNLTVINVSDDVFGYYRCVVVDQSMNISVVTWGLNVDGADFSELMEQYEENAIIGGIAAGAMLVLVGGACLVWHFRYSRRSEDTIEVVKTREMVDMYSNAAFKPDIETTDVDGAGDKGGAAGTAAR